LDRARLVALVFAVAAAVLAVAASQVASPYPDGGRVLSAAAAIAAGLAALAQRRNGFEQIRDWTRARSTSEALKSEIYSYLAGGSDYLNDGDRRLRSSSAELFEQVSDLQRHTLRVEPDSKPLPAVHSVSTYITVRLNGQVDDYYRPKAAVYARRGRRLRTAQDLLGVGAVVLAATAATFNHDGLNVWVPVVTTVGASLAAHITAARYDHLVIEFLRTAQHLIRLRDDYLDNPSEPHPTLIDTCEQAISVENQGWMARWQASDESAQA
jgi:hypothetical protein